MKRRLLSKSKYLNGLQCPKYLWLLFNDKDKVPQPDTSTQHVFDEGHRVGEFAKSLFLDGIEIPSDDFIGNLNKTREALKENLPLFEPGFYVDGYFSRLDILNPVGDGAWDIYEVKGATSVKEINIHDAFTSNGLMHFGFEHLIILKPRTYLNMLPQLGHKKAPCKSCTALQKPPISGIVKPSAKGLL